MFYYSLLQILFYKCLIGTLVFLLDSFGSQKISHVTAPRLNTVWTVGKDKNSIEQKLFYYQWIISNNSSSTNDSLAMSHGPWLGEMILTSHVSPLDGREFVILILYSPEKFRKLFLKMRSPGTAELNRF